MMYAVLEVSENINITFKVLLKPLLLERQFWKTIKNTMLEYAPVSWLKQYIW